jgi:hypothetical protein
MHKYGVKVCQISRRYLLVYVEASNKGSRGIIVG